MDMMHDSSGSSSRLLPRDQMDLASRISSSNESFRSRVAHGPLIIQKVPQSVRNSLDERYFVPEVVSIGPYHHRANPHLVEMEEVKESVMHEFCRAAFPRESVTATVSRFHDVVRSALLPNPRSYYADRFANITDNEFDYMMVVDGCFLLAVMAILTRSYPNGLEHSSWTSGRMLRIMKDILLFENQIPWAVMRSLIGLWRVPVVDKFVSRVLAYFDFDVHIHTTQAGASNTRTPAGSSRGGGRSTACDDDDGGAVLHLLDLIHQRHLGLNNGHEPDSNGGNGTAVRYCDYARPFAHFTSAVELAEAGIRLHGSGTCRVKDGVRVDEEPRLLRIGQLVLPKLALSWLPRCWLINMVALECMTDRSDRSGVSSYLAILGSLVRAERDVQELRSRRILFSTMSDRRTVEFFEGLLDPLPRQELYLRTLEDIVRLRSRRSIRSGIHAFYYRNRRVIFAVAPLLVAIIGIVVTNSIKHK